MNEKIDKIFDIFRIVIMIMCIIAYRLAKYLFISLGSILALMSIGSKNIGTIITSFIIGNIIGMILLLFFSTYFKILFKRYSVVQIRRNSNEICARIDVSGSKTEIMDKFKDDLANIIKDNNKPSAYLTTKTQALFVAQIIRSFLSGKDDEDIVRKKVKKFIDNFTNVSINTQEKYESDDGSVEITVLYYGDKMNTNNAIYKIKKWSDLKEASKEIPQFKVDIKINDNKKYI